MSRQYNTVWQRHRRDLRYDRLMNSYYNACAENDGWDDYEIIRLEWRKSSYMLFFEMNGYERHVNIIQQSREICGRLTAEKRSKIEANLPKKIRIYTSCETFYSQGCPYNIGGYRYIHTVSGAALRKWFEMADVI